MKKIISILLALMLATSFVAGCSQERTTTEGEDTEVTTPAEEGTEEGAATEEEGAVDEEIPTAEESAESDTETTE